MKIFFLFLTFCLILTVHAQRPIHQYSCLLSHSDGKTPFYLEVDKSKRMTINNQRIEAMVTRGPEMVEISLARTIAEVNSTNTRTEKKLFPKGARKLLVELMNEGADHLMLECVPRDP